MFLDGIIGKVDHWVHILDIVFLATGTNVTLTVPIASDETVMRGD